MKYLEKRLEFLSESVLMELLKETVVYYSPDARDLIYSICQVYQLPVAADLFELEGEPIDADMTLIDFSKDGKYFTYKTSRNITKLIDDEKVDLPVDRNGFWVTKPDHWGKIYTKNYLDGTYPDSEFWKEPRGQVKIGRFINNVFPGKYNNNDIENFSLKVRMRKTGEGRTIKVVEGEEMIKWYNAANNISLATLGSSCMRYDQCSTYFDIYTKNPEICKMVCIFEGDKLVARALIWKVTTKSEGDFEWFMDRRYYAFEELDDRLKDYAIEQGWAFKTINSFTNTKSVTVGTKVFDCDMEIQLENFEGITKFPYVDTFKKYYPEKGVLMNSDSKGAEQVEFYVLDSTGGSFTRVRTADGVLQPLRPEGEKNMVYSEYLDEWIEPDDSIWSEWHQSWILEEDAVLATLGSSRGWYPEDSEDLVYIDSYGEYANRDDCSYSDYYNEYILQDDGIEVVSTIDIYGYTREEGYLLLRSETSEYVTNDEIDNWMWYDYFSRKWDNWRYFDGVYKELLTKDYEDCWIPKKFAIKTYAVKGEDFRLTSDDAKLLGYEIEPSSDRIEDSVSYDHDICLNEEWYEKVIKVATADRKQRLEDFKINGY